MRHQRLDSNYGGGYGTLIPVLPKTDFDNSFLAASGTYDTIIQNAIAVAPYSSAILMVRAHTVDILDASVGFEVYLFEVDPSDEDGADFIIDAASSEFLKSDPVDGNTSAPALLKASASNPGAYLRVVVRGTMGSSTGKLAATLSADLVLRAGV